STPRDKSQAKKTRQHDTPAVRASKTMSFLLRHGAQKEGLKMRKDGYVNVDDLLKHPKMRHMTFLQLEEIVKTNEKQRFKLIFEPPAQGNGESSVSSWWIRANQGHTLEEVEVEMIQVTDPAQIPIAIHGTNKEAWDHIARQGLSRMKRHHIHLAQGLPGVSGVISGMRKSANVIIYIDVPKALAAGIQFYISANGVILSPGNEQGFIPPEFFKRVE
ncbi:phosphotransferase KptA/Tpt1, partial [Sistotremastrum suecicum HHB10207 ss-3]